jgi:hypothetical protein
MHTEIRKGAAIIDHSGLRCSGMRHNNPDILCHHLLAKLNSRGDIAGSFRCPKCKQDIEV